MTYGSVLLIAPDTSWPVKVLAVVGGAFLGALATGLVVQLLAKLLTGRKVPRYPLWALRGLGGILVGWLVALAIFPGAGFGFGGWPFGSGTHTSGPKDQGAKLVSAPKVDDTSQQDRSSDKAKAASADQVLRLEVLTDGAIEQLIGKEGVIQKRYYRLEGAKANDLLTLAALKEKIHNHLKQQPPLRRLDIVIGKDSPDKDSGRVAELRDWAEAQHLIVATPKQ